MKKNWRMPACIWIYAFHKAAMMHWYLIKVIALTRSAKADNRETGCRRIDMELYFKSRDFKSRSYCYETVFKLLAKAMF